MRKLNPLLGLILFFLGQQTILGHRAEHECVHDKLFKNQEIKKLPNFQADGNDKNIKGGHNQSNRFLEESTEPTSKIEGKSSKKAIRIFVDYSHPDKYVLEDHQELTSAYKMSIRLLTSVKTYLQKSMKVISGESLQFAGGECSRGQVSKFKKDIDLFVKVFAENESQSAYSAAARACFYLPTTNRPVVGAFIINFGHMDRTDNSVFEYFFFSTFLHEFMHIMGFSRSLFNKYIDSNNKVIPQEKVAADVPLPGSNTKIFSIVMPGVVSYAKDFFGCSELQGLPLENNGGSSSSGSHWEKMFMPQEILNPTVEYPGIISKFTFLFLEGTGWYYPDYSFVQRYDWGKGEGCNVFKSCPQLKNSCTKQTSFQECSPEWHSKGICFKSESFGGGCLLKRALKHSCTKENIFESLPGETYGPGSRCVEYLNSDSKCHKVFCIGQSAVNIKVGSDTITCSANDKGKTVNTSAGGSLRCPDLSNYCDEFSSRCPNDCSTNGYCLENKKCFCLTGHSGDDCSVEEKLDYHVLRNKESQKSEQMALSIFLLTISFSLLI